MATCEVGKMKKRQLNKKNNKTLLNIVTHNSEKREEHKKNVIRVGKNFTDGGFCCRDVFSDDGEVTRYSRPASVEREETRLQAHVGGGSGEYVRHGICFHGSGARDTVSFQREIHAECGSEGGGRVWIR